MSCCSCFSFLQPPSAGLEASLEQHPVSRHVSKSKLRRMPSRQGSITFREAYQVSDDVLGAGAFGEVRMCTSKGSTVKKVAKIMVKSRIPDECAFMDELMIQADLDHPHICNIFDWFTSEETITLVLELCEGGDLSDAILESNVFAEADSKHFMTQILKGVNYMHGTGVSHRDLKPENFMLRSKGVPHLDNDVKIVDFGFARDFKPGAPPGGEGSMKTKCGTPNYMAPEILEKDYYNEKCDMWSCGVILYFFLCGEWPYDGDSINDIMQAAKQKATFDCEVWKTRAPTARLAIVQMLHRDPSQRHSARQALAGPFFTKDIPKNNAAKVENQLVVERMRRYKTWGKFQRAFASLVLFSLPDAKKNELLRTFEEMDADNDGLLSLEELQEGLSDRTPEDVAELFRAMDTSNDGQVSWTQFLSAMASRDMLCQEESLRQAFEIMDSNGSGSVSLQELRGLFAKYEEGLGDSEEFNKFDTNGDGMIDFDEFRAIMTHVVPCTASGGFSMGACLTTARARRPTMCDAVVMKQSTTRAQKPSMAVVMDEDGEVITRKKTMRLRMPTFSDAVEVF